MLPQDKLYWALEASAGTGKTFNLAVRFIELILSGAGISQIMALTFTKKAANEMKERIIRNFLDLENQKNELKLIADDLNLGFDEILALRDKKRVEFLNSNLNISTFDSFFNKIIKLFALNCGVDPHFGIDDTILKHQQKIFIDEIIKNPRDFANLINLIANLDAKKDKILANLDYLQENQVEIANFTNPKFPNLNSINSLLDEILELLKKGEFSQKAIDIFDKPRKISEIMKISVLNRETLAEHSFFKKAYTPELDEKFIALKDEI
ncbi:MAG: UvrD-helicase domain-containing protein, partial [Campylobacter sp.]|nr:UvrD-helicase domain-containing protein [Campylobacter sp.]